MYDRKTQFALNNEQVTKGLFIKAKEEKKYIMKFVKRTPVY